MPTIFAWVRFVGAVVAVPTRRTLAVVIVHQIHAGSVVAARSFGAFVDFRTDNAVSTVTGVTPPICM